MTSPTDIRVAAGAIILAMTIIGLIDSLVVWVAREGGLWQFHLMRSAMALPMIAVWARVAGAPLVPRRMLPVLGRSLAVAMAMVLYFGVLGFLTVGQAAAGLFTSPIFVLLLSMVVFGHRVGWRRLGAVLLGFAGVLLVLRPEAGGFGLLQLMPVVAGAFYALGVLATREWCAGEDALTLLFAFYAMLGGLAGCGVVLTSVSPAQQPDFLTQGWVAPSAAFLGLTCVQAMGSVVAVWFLTRAYQIAEASRVAGFEYTLLVAAAGWGFVLFGQTPGLSGWLGIALIVASGLFLARRSGPRSLKEGVDADARLP